MKKAVLKFKSGSGAIFAFLIIALVFLSVAGVVYIVISKSPAKTPEAALLPSNYAPVTQKVYPYQDTLFFGASVDATGVSGRTGKCDKNSGTFSCSMGFLTFVANEPVGYTVTFWDYSGSAANFTKTGQVNAKADGSADIGWSLDYTISAWPSTKGSCAGAGSLCKVKNISGVNTWGNTTTFIGLEPSTAYETSHCVYNCSSTTPFEYHGWFLTGGAALSNNGVPSMVCSNGNVDATANWKNIDMLDEEVWLDYSLNNNNFTPADSYSSVRIGRYNSAPFGRNDSKTIVALPANTSYYWRIKTKNASFDNNIWMYSQTGTFKTISCSLPTPTPTPTPTPKPSPLPSPTPTPNPIACTKLDVNDDLGVDSSDTLLVLKHYGESGPSPYDVNDKDGVDNTDALLVHNAFGMECK